MLSNDKWLLKTNEGGDWMIIYKNRKFLEQGHSLSFNDAFRLLGVELEEIEVSDEEMEELCGGEDDA